MARCSAKERHEWSLRTIAAIFVSKLLDLLVAQTILFIDAEVRQHSRNGTSERVFHLDLLGDETPEKWRRFEGGRDEPSRDRQGAVSKA